MSRPKIPKRSPYFIGCEGDGDQSYVLWLQMLADETGLHISLDARNLGGGGYKSMLNAAVKKKADGKYIASFMIVDADRAGRDGEWTVTELRTKAAIHNIQVCLHRPSLEGLFWRMFPGNETSIPNANNAEALLKKVWTNYSKPMNARELKRQFNLVDIIRVSNHDSDVEFLMRTVKLLP